MSVWTRNSTMVMISWINTSGRSAVAILVNSTASWSHHRAARLHLQEEVMEGHNHLEEWKEPKSTA